MAAKELNFLVTDWDTFKKYFLLTHPNQTLNSTSVLTDDDWIKYRILLFTRGSYEKSFSQEFAENNKPPVDKNIITLV